MYKGVCFTDRIYLEYLRSKVNHPGSRKLQRVVTKYFFKDRIQLISTYGIKFLLNTSDYIDQLIVRNGDYEPGSLALCYNLLRNGGVFVDVGSNFGLYSLNMINIPNLRIIAIEPNPLMSQKLIKNALINYTDRIELVTAAVGNGTDLVELYSPAMNNSGNFQISLVKRNGQFLLPQIKLDLIIEKLKIEEIDLLKIDVEGYEKFVLEGIDFKGVKPLNILMEIIPEQLKNFSCTVDDILSMLSHQGYSWSDIYGRTISSFDQIPESNVLFSLSKIKV